MRALRRTGGVLVIAAALVLGLAAGCSPSEPTGRAGQPDRAAPQAFGTKRITVAIRGEPTSLNYTMTRAGGGGAAGTSEVDLLLNAGLVVEDASKRLTPQLAQAVPGTENGLWRFSPDGRMETTWTIRPGAMWHDGVPFTAHDLVFTLLVGMDEDLALVRYPAYAAIETVEARDSHTLTIAWKRPFIQADALFSIAVGWPIPRHVLEPIYLEDKSRLISSPYWTAAYVGAGPYRMREWVTGSHALLDAFEDYPLGRPKVDRIDVKFILDPTTLVANILAGEVDMNLGRGISLDQALQAQWQWPAGKLDTALQSWYALYPQFLTPSPAVVAELPFRRALMHATDRHQMASTFMGGLTTVADTVIAPSEREYEEIKHRAVSYAYDPRRSAELIEDMGYTRAADGIYRDGAGQRLAVEVRTGAGDALQEKLVLTIVDYWQQAGVGGESHIFPAQRSNDLEFRQTRPAFEMVRQPSEVVRFHSSSTPLPENGFRGNNRTRYRSAELDALIDRYFLTIPWGDRMDVLGQIVFHLSDNLVAMGILYDAQPMLIANRLVNVSAGLQSANAHQWDVR